MSMNQYWGDLEQPEYDPMSLLRGWPFVPDLLGEYSTAQQLHTAFLTAIKDLKLMHEKQMTKCEELEDSVREEEKAHWARMAGLI